MRGNDKETVSVWHGTGKQIPPFFSLHENTGADVCVVGGGIAGLTTAYLLQKEGKAVVLVEAWDLASGETGRTTAHLSAVLDDRFYELERLFGEEKSRLAAESHRAAIDRIESIVQSEGIKCDFERLDGYLVAPTAEQQKQLEKEAAASRRAGFTDNERLTRVPLPGVDIGPALRFPDQATFNIIKYMRGMADTFQQMGGRIYTGTRVRGFQGGKDAWVETENGVRIDATAIVVATNTPVNDRVKMHTKQAAYRTYVIAYKLPKGRLPGFLLWDMADPYHYARIVRGDTHDFLVVGGEDHKTGQADDASRRYRRLERWTNQYFPVDEESPAYRWSGQIMEPVDSLGFIGRNPGGHDNVYIATGDSGHGMTHGTIAGMLITDLIQDRDNRWKELYAPYRKTLQATPSFAKENVNFMKWMVSDWVRPGEVKSADAIPFGEGAIIRRGATKVAVYRDEEGRLHEHSAICTHLGCMVQWNSGEKSWDCPCHGSRFDTQGRILNGPAVKPLEPAEPKPEEVRKTTTGKPG